MPKEETENSIPPGSSRFPWIKNARSDLLFFSFGWVPLVFAFLLVNQMPFRDAARYWLAAFVLLISCLHRHLTFPLVYGDSQKFGQRPRSYILLPVFFLALTLVSILYLHPARLRSGPLSSQLELTPRDGINFRVYEGKNLSLFPTRFRGGEKTPEEIASSLNGQLDGKIHVEARGDRLNFTFASRKRGEGFRIASFSGSPQLAGALGLSEFQEKKVTVGRPLFTFLAVGAGLWCLYHALMQKAGILRIYSRKGGYGRPWLDKAMIFSWASFVLFALASLPKVQREFLRVAAVGKFLHQMTKNLGEVLPALALVAGAVALVLTFLYLRQECVKGRPFLWSKNLFMFSIVALFAVFFYDVVAGYVVFGFSHALEYLAFVNIFSRKSYLLKPAASSWMAKWVRRQGLAFGAFVGALTLIFVPWFFTSRMTLEFYVVGSSFLHFIYDGWIWKVRDPAVGKPLGIQYPVPAVAS